MIIKNIDTLISYPNLWEEYIEKICRREYIDLEFDNDYEPEIKLKLFYENIKISTKASNTNFSSLKLHEQFVEILFGILRRFDTSNINYDVFYHVLLALELIKPQDKNNVLRLLIQENKFVFVESLNYKINLQLKLVSIFLNNLTDSENINFIGEYLYKESISKRYISFPVFNTILLRYLIRFKSDSDYFSMVESLIHEKTSKHEVLQLIVSIEEYLRIKMSYVNFYLWVVKVLRQDLECDTLLCNFIYKNIYPVINNIAKNSNNKIFYLLLAEINLLELDNCLDDVIVSLQKFSDTPLNPLVNESALSNYFTDIMFLIECKGYEMSIDSNSKSVHIHKTTFIAFQSVVEPKIINLSDELYIKITSLKFPNVIKDFEFIAN
ncbi:MAG: hypothetical protein WBO44_14335 [Saprospiraceae bacterium]